MHFANAAALNKSFAMQKWAAMISAGPTLSIKVFFVALAIVSPSWKQS